MNRVQSLTQAYSQAPWRKQLQYIGLFLLGLIMVALVAGVYLNITARAATVGRDIQRMHTDIETTGRAIEDLQTQLALLTSNTEMEKRASALGFRPVTAEEMVYIKVSGYARPDQVTLAMPPGHQIPGAPVLSPEFTESLFDWLRESVLEPAAPLIQESRP